MIDETSYLGQQRSALIARRLAPFAIGWLGALGIWLLTFAAEGRLTSGAVLMVGVQVLALGVALAICRAAPTAPRVLPVVVVASVLLALATMSLVQDVGAYGEILAFMLLTLYLAAALVFSWGWRAELALLLATLAPWGLLLGRFVFFVPPIELAAAIAIGAALAIAIAEGYARNFRTVLRRRRSEAQATSELQLSRDAYRDLAESVPDMIWACDARAHFTYVNASLARFVGATPADLQGRRITDFFTADPRNPDLLAVIERAAAGAPAAPLLIEITTPTGPRWIEAVSSVVRDGDGGLVGMRGISRDVTERHVAGERLQASEARYRSLVESQREWVVRMDLQGRVLFVNDAYQLTFGEPSEALVGRTVAHLVHPDDRQLVMDSLGSLEHPPYRTMIECRNLTPHGIRWVSWEGGAVLDEHGRPVEIQSVGRDVTERRIAEDALRASEARYRGLVESAHELVTRFDRAGNLTFANDSYCQAIGHARGNIVGQNPMFLVHPDDRDAVMASFRAAMQPPYRARRESRGLTPTGWCWFEWELSGIRDASDQVIEVQQVGRDMTARRQAEANLRESEERFRSAFDDAAIGMAVTALDGRTLRVNRALCEMLGYSVEALLASTPDTIVHPDDHQPFQADRSRLTDGQAQSYRAERRYRRSDGGVVWVHVTASMVRDAHGTPLYLIGQIQDITERHLAEEALQESLADLRRSEDKLRLLAQRQAAIREEERKRLGFDLHDDVCQELVGVGILVESLRRKLAPMPAEHAAGFARVVGYLGEVVEHLRLLARELRPLLLRDLGLDGSLRSLTEGLSSATLQVVTEIQVPIPRLEEEVEVTVYRIAQEALANAVRHAGARTIVVRLAAEDGMLHLAVRDDGCGFDPAVRPVVSLGLASMEERALALGGRLEIRAALDGGTTVALTFPLEGRIPGRFREPADPSPTRSSSPPSATTTPRSAARD